ncbi:unknown protein [Simkania negevensis Z]|uniref:Uncharacterized protein n=1 Tax=Simkania negevensis (strain ATCC VR-1471 / DSM 27360 / Z) TaxID=331113 RepID=F8L5G9_SIMNZ|nr:unknown protein [Simkania negevensis Z]
MKLFCFPLRVLSLIQGTVLLLVLHVLKIEKGGIKKNFNMR